MPDRFGSWGGLVAVVVVIVAASCGSPQKPGGGGTTGAGGDSGNDGDVAAAGGPVTPENACARIFALKADDTCSLVSSITLTEDECRAEWNRALNERGPESRTAHTNLGRCLLDNGSCDAISSCVEGLNQFAGEQDGSPSEFRTCEQTEVYAPVGLERAEWEKRRGAGASRYSEVKTTKEEPVEVCGIPAQMEWLLAASCNDGSRPFSDYDHAHAMRVGNVGGGGSCGSIIDLYEVPCPEGTYSIYIDAYVCPLPEPD